MPDNKDQAIAVAGAQSETALERVEKKILEHFRPEIWMALRAGLAVIGSTSFKDRPHPLALIFEGASGRGKSTVINMCAPISEDAKAVVLRVDNFTPASFVSHAASVSKEELCCCCCCCSCAQYRSTDDRVVYPAYIVTLTDMNDYDTGCGCVIL